MIIYLALLSLVLTPTTYEASGLEPSMLEETENVPLECQVSAEELIQTKKDYFQAKKEADRTKISLALFAVLAAICKIVVSLAKLSSPFFKSPAGKVAIRFTTLGVGIFVFLFSHLAAGESWLDSIILGACGPFSVVVHEYSKLIFPTKEKPDGETKASDSKPDVPTAD